MLELRGERLLIWLAALIDGEGSVMLGKRVYSKSEKPKRNDYIPGGCSYLWYRRPFARGIGC